MSGSFINKTSYVENCETSAWGRALANFGIGLGTSVASADEVANAIENQKSTKTKLTKSSKQDTKTTYMYLACFSRPLLKLC